MSEKTEEELREEAGQQGDAHDYEHGGAYLFCLHFREAPSCGFWPDD